ncbi:MAG: hypothetical protein KDD60_00365 [Bdellovibrionales bacterium]|nr:hypothetical protein [Bdellovibrionales bacterium]
MPIYVYEREDGTSFELIQKLSENVLEKCPTTGQKVKRLFAPTAIHFKGTGFYQTDYKPSTGGSSESGSSDSSSKGSSDKGSGGCNGAGPAGGCGACS